MFERLQYRPLPYFRIGYQCKDVVYRAINEWRGLFETGAGGSAPKHVQQFNKKIT